MNVPENICPVCKNMNELEAVVCWSCGARLEDPYMDPGARTKTTDSLEHAAEGLKGFSVDEATIPHKGIAIYVEGVNGPAYVDSKGEFVIGRMADRTSGIAEALLDLSPFGGYGLGISRRHVIIRRAEHGYEVIDLGSVNGTWLNDERLAPHKPIPLASGSHLRLGRMTLLVHYRPFAESR